MNWRPGADLSALHARAQLLATIRTFFSEREVLEVETPLLCRSGVTDPNIEAITADIDWPQRHRRYLQTSPEYAMKRLLAAYNTPIYQICKAFRAGEAGARHNPEFTLLEWYRPGFGLPQLMDEVAELVTRCVGVRPVSHISYRTLFQQHLNLDPFTASLAALRTAASAHIDVGELDGDRDLWLDLLLSHAIEPQLASGGLCFVYHYPASQAALAQVAEVDGVRVAQRFELYLDGMELANGYLELTDAQEQRLRFDTDNATRRERAQAERPVDENLLAALDAGLSSCSGVAIGLDRLLAQASGHSDIRNLLAFDWSRA